MQEMNWKRGRKRKVCERNAHDSRLTHEYAKIVEVFAVFDDPTGIQFSELLGRCLNIGRALGDNEQPVARGEGHLVACDDIMSLLPHHRDLHAWWKRSAQFA